MAIKAVYNNTYLKVAFQWLNQALCSYHSFCLVDTEVLLNRQLLVARNHYKPLYHNQSSTI